MGDSFMDSYRKRKKFLKEDFEEESDEFLDEE